MSGILKFNLKKDNTAYFPLSSYNPQSTNCNSHSFRKVLSQESRLIPSVTSYNINPINQSVIDNNNQIIKEEEMADFDYTESSTLNNSQIKKRMNWTFLNERKDYTLFNQSRDIKSQRKQRVNQIEGKLREESERIVKTAFKQKRFNSQILSHHYYNKVMGGQSQIHVKQYDLQHEQGDQTTPAIIMHDERQLNNSQLEKATMNITPGNRQRSSNRTHLSITYNHQNEPKTVKHKVKSSQNTFYDLQKIQQQTFQQEDRKKIQTSEMGDQKYCYILKQMEKMQQNPVVLNNSKMQQQSEKDQQASFFYSTKDNFRSKSTREQSRIRSTKVSSFAVTKSSNSKRPTLTRPVTQNSRLYTRQTDLLSKIIKSNEKLDKKLDVKSTQNLKIQDAYRDEVMNIIQELDQTYMNIGTNDESTVQKTIQNSQEESLLLDENISISEQKTKRNPDKEYKQTSIASTIEPNEVSRRMNKQQLVGLENPFNRMKIKESDIPIDMLYNKQINALKRNEKQFQMQARPLNFSVWENYDGVEGHNLGRFHLQLNSSLNDFVLEHEFVHKKNQTKPNSPNNNGDVGIPSYGFLQTVTPVNRNRNSSAFTQQKAYSPTTFTGFYNQKGETESDNHKLAFYAHNLNLKENFPDQVKYMTQKQRAEDIQKFQKRVTMRFNTKDVPESNKNIQNRSMSDVGTIGIMNKSTRYAKLLEDCLKIVKNDFNKEEGKSPRKRQNHRKEKPNIDELIDKQKYQLEIVRPDVSYLLEKKNQDDKAQLDEISCLKVRNNEELERVMSRQYYGRWYVQPNNWNQLKNKGFEDQNIVKENSNKKQAKSQRVSPSKSTVIKQTDWNQQYKHEIKRRVYHNEFALTKLLERIKERDEKQAAKNSKKATSHKASPMKERMFLINEDSQQKLSQIDIFQGHVVKQDIFQQAEEFVKDIQKIMEGRDDDSTLDIRSLTMNKN